METREVARGLLVRPDGHVLLYVLEDGRYALPGGGVEPGETHQEALARELHEELGLRAARIRPLVWTREHVYERGGKLTAFRERHFLVEVDADCPSGPGRFVDLADSAAPDRFAPAQLPVLVAQLRAGGPPATPQRIDG